MATTRRADLTAAAQQYLLAFRGHGGDEGVTPSGIARELAVSKQAAAEMFRRLADDQLIAPCSGHARLWRLTAAGESAADAVFRRHALLEWLLTGIVGMPWAAADVEARRLHASISAEFETRLEELLGHPQTCPHGNPVDRAAEEKIGEELVAVGGHRDEITALLLRGPEDFGWRIAERQKGGDLESGNSEAAGRALEVFAVGLHLIGLVQLQLLEIACGPPVRDMQEQELRPDDPGQFRNVRLERLVGAGVFEGDQDLLVHGGRRSAQSRPAARSSQPPQARVQVRVLVRV